MRNRILSNLPHGTASAILTLPILIPLVYYGAILSQRLSPSLTDLLPVFMLVCVGMVSVDSVSSPRIKRFSYIVIAWFLWQAIVNVGWGAWPISWWRLMERATGVGVALIVLTGVRKSGHALSVAGAAASGAMLFIVTICYPDPTGQMIYWFGFGNINMTVHYLLPPIVAWFVWVWWPKEANGMGEPWPRRCLALLGLLALVMIVVETSRRGAYLAFGTCISGLIVDRWHRWSPRWCIIGVCLAVMVSIGLVAGIIATDQGLGNRSHRILQYKACWSLAEAHWLTGQGGYGVLTMLGSLDEAPRRFVSAGLYLIHAHNEFLDAFLDAGILGAILMIIGFVMVVVAAHGIRDARLRATMVALTWSCIPGLLFDNSFARIEGSCFLGMWAALIFIARTQDGEQEVTTGTPNWRSAFAIFGVKCAVIVSSLWGLIGTLPSGLASQEATLEGLCRVMRRTYHPEMSALMAGIINENVKDQETATIAFNTIGQQQARLRNGELILLVAANCAANSRVKDEVKLAWSLECMRVLPFKMEPMAWTMTLLNRHPDWAPAVNPIFYERLLLVTGERDRPTIPVSDRLERASTNWCRLWGRASTNKKPSPADWDEFGQLVNSFGEMPPITETFHRMLLLDPSLDPDLIRKWSLLAIRSPPAAERLAEATTPQQAKALLLAMSMIDERAAACAAGKRFRMPTDDKGAAMAMQIMRLKALSEAPVRTSGK